MNPPKAQEGLWPYSGWPRLTVLVQRPRGGRWYVTRTREEADCIFAEGGAALEVVCASLAAELVEALEAVCDETRLVNFGEEDANAACETIRDVVEAALNSYRARMGEGEQ